MTTVEERPTTDRTPPHDTEAEQAALGGMLLSPETINDVTNIITSRDLYRPAHATIFNTITDQHARGEPTDPVSIAARLMEQGTLRTAGGAAYLHTLIEAVPAAANAAYYATIVRKRARRRRAIEAGTRITQLGYSTDIDDNDLADRANQIIQDATSDTLHNNLTFVGDLAQDFLDALEAGEQTGLPTGLVDLDRLFGGGLQPGTVTVVAGRPGAGKSVCLADFARAAGLRQRQPTVYFTLEMRKMQLLRRIYSAEARVPLHVLKQGGTALSDDDWARVTRVAAEISDAPLCIEDCPSLSISGIAATTRRLAQRKALGLVLVDYLQLMDGVAGNGNDSREREVARISRGLKVLAADLNVPVVVAAQLNRGPEQRNDKRPVLSDLRESGAIESDADVVILLHRPDYYDKESERAGEVDLIVAKHRDGATDTITAAAQLHFSRFVDMALPADNFYANAARRAA
jgi:replicative DNA helicase